MTFLSEHDVGRFVLTPRSLLHALLVTGEATWLTYVISDVLLVIAPREAALSAALSSYSVWAVTLLLELFWPLQPTLTIDRTCSQRGVVLSLQCSSGTVAFGSSQRLLLLVAVNGIASLVSILFVRVTASMRVPRQLRTRRASTLTSAAAEAFLELPGDDAWSIDPALGCMMGVFHFTWRRDEYHFDTKLWMSFLKASAGPCIDVVPPNAPPVLHVAVTNRRAAIVKVSLGLCYLLATVGSSVYYLQLSSVNLANDLWWVSFNTTGMQTYLANWFNRYLWLTPRLENAPLNLPMYADVNAYATNTTSVSIMDMLPRRLHFEVASDLPLAIHGLRATNPCFLPWIATQYCWVDFERRWAMANSAAREARCAAKYATNAAVYLEAPLRNTDWDGFETCWGDVFATGIAADLRQDLGGRLWLEATQANANSEESEVAYWISTGLVAYTAAWQNYKSVGVFNTFNVVTALGRAFPFTLQASNGSFHVETQTSYKMYWNLASDFWALATNDSGVAGKSLLRSSSRFAFANTSLLDVYYRNGSMSAPLDPVYHVFQSHLGAFGSVDLHHVPCPASLAALVRDVHEALRRVLANTTDSNGGYTAQIAYLQLVTMQGLVAVPSSLDASSQYSAGSNLLCHAPLSSFNLSFGLPSYFGVAVGCNVVFGEWVYVMKDQILFALLASGVALAPTLRIPSTCKVEAVSPSDCRAMLTSISAFLHTYFAPAYLQALRAQAQRVQVDVNALSVDLVTYVKDASTNEISLFHQRIVDDADVPLQLTGWTNLYDWVLGFREVVAFEADNASLTVMSTAYMTTTFAASAAEVPVNVATYLRVFCQYISLLLLVLSLVAMSYTVQNRFTSEGFNLFEVNRVGGMVWIGRPMLFLRSVTALCILSTATLQLQLAGNATTLDPARQDVSPFLAICTKVLAAGELGWLVYIADDICMVITQQYTASYTIKGAFLAWAMAAILSLIAPVAHSVDLELHCAVDVTDYQAVSVLMYLHDRLRYTLPPPTEKPSYLLSCGAKYLFEKTGWVHDGVYHVDVASAALTGLLTWRQQDVIHVFDVKTWRVHAIRTTASMQKGAQWEPRLHGALPLVE
ncbi:hypothetical protein SPRG_11831 [Saprolegnia parasitica CBS 223.65]|uniref:Uncharacterized protein n=1 Tax=Saprolegnia parasitica (strain CBS 223.65) TaxID=695850 RepID=A0A067BWR2_SAPPC|nr:hypothetical protein SPRG_11831 [Saprolegnia parasitica CBS 223.65]KDO22984.1 hypothetical protein SPRG_11831 [Saprolegnia parasitica CBS 223.65]|eukprot:XP_012206275.1 hypothetical protein SPRG_11831 [Saprolegnia parasitica CBS 223.65]